MSDASMQPDLFVHTHRPQWGLALLTEDAEDRRSFLFQDGRTRVFKQGFFHLLEPADKPRDVLLRVRESLRARLGTTATQRTVLERSAQNEVIGIETQVEVFKSLFPGGFQGEAYTDRHRGTHAASRLKRHLDPAVTHAQQALSAEALSALIEAGDYAAVHTAACAVVTGTGMVAPAERRALCALPDDRKQEFAEALFNLLHGDAPAFDRFTRWIVALTDETHGAPKWPVTTVLPALVHPETEICVKVRPFAREASWLAPQLVVGKQLDAVVYDRLRKMALTLKGHLEAAGLHPRDLLDVSTFMVLAFKPKHLALVADDSDDDSDD